MGVVKSNLYKFIQTNDNTWVPKSEGLLPDCEILVYVSMKGTTPGVQHLGAYSWSVADIIEYQSHRVSCGGG